MANKELFTRIQLKYDTFANWTNDTLGDGKGAKFVLKAGEIGICAIPSGKTAVNGDAVRPQVMFKVGDGTSTFDALPWVSAKAADVYDWAKQAALPVTKVGTGNVVSSISWDETTKGIKFETTSVATSTELSNLTTRVKNIEDTYATDTELSTAVNTINAEIAKKADKTYVDEELAKKVNSSDFESFKTINSQAIAKAQSDAEDYADSLAGNYATADQGAKADSAVQSVKVLGETLTDGDELTVDEAKTALGLKSAAYTESSAYATAAQGTLAASALQKADITSGSANGTIAVKGADVAVTGLGDAAYTTVSALNATAQGYATTAKNEAIADAKNKADKALDDAKSYTDGEIDKVEATIGKVVDGTTPVAKATNADQLGGVVAANYATKKYVDDADAEVLQDAKDYADEVKKAILTGDSTKELKEAYDTLIEIQEWIEGPGVNATELAEAIAAEAKTRGEEDTKLQNQINALGITDGKVANAAVADVANSLADSAKAEVKVVKVDNAVHADTADKATKDGNGKVIADTYQTIAQAEEDFNALEDYVDDAKATLIGSSSAASTSETIYGAKKYAEEKATAAKTAAIDAAAEDATSKANTAESNAKTYADGLIAALDVTDTAVSGKYVSAVSEENGKIKVTRADLPVDTLVTGTANGTVKFNGTDVAVKGLGSAAYTESSAYATAEQGRKADAAISSISVGSGLKRSTTTTYVNHSTVSNVAYEGRGIAGILLDVELPENISYLYDAVTVVINGTTHTDVTFTIEGGKVLAGVTGYTTNGTATSVTFRQARNRTVNIELDNDATNYFVINCGSSTTVI